MARKGCVINLSGEHRKDGREHELRGRGTHNHEPRWTMDNQGNPRCIHMVQYGESVILYDIVLLGVFGSQARSGLKC